MSYNLNPDPVILFRDAQHATRLFGADDFRLAPKYKFLFHVSFGINASAVKSTELLGAYKNEINMLVKSVNLPSVDIITTQVNQYNRKKVVQTGHRLKPVRINFHDDNMGLINLLWQNYYSYYYADPISATVPGSYKRNATLNPNYITTPYGLDNGSVNNFFNYIKIYQMARHQYVSYTLYNPLISSWDHKELDYKSNEAHENTMMVDYEAISYNTGVVTAGDPEGFGLDHYDQTPSPLTGSSSTPVSPLTPVADLDIAQKTAIAADQVNSVLGKVTSGLNAAITGINTVKSTINAVSGLANTVFPTAIKSAITQALPVKLF